MLTKYTLLSVATLGFIATASADTRIVLFGNSLSDVGNAKRTLNPQGVPWWKGRFSNGPVWNEYLAKWSNHTLVNFAVAGAVSNNTSVQVFDNLTLDIPDTLQQIDTFNATFGGKFSDDVLSNDIAVVEIGGNDILDGITGLYNGTTDANAYSISISSSIGAAVSKLVDMGYKKFVVSNIPDISSCPAGLNAPAASRTALSAFITATNTRTQTILSNMLKDSSLGIKYIRTLDLFNLIVEMQKPEVNSALGLKNTTAPCYVENTNRTVISSCEDPDTYAFMDPIHPTTRAHALLGAVADTLFQDGSFNVTTESLVDLISKYKLKDISSSKNPLYNDDTYTTGVTNVPTIDIEKSQANAAEIANAANESASNSTSSTTSSSSKSSSSSSSSSSSKSSTSAAGSAKFSFSKLATLAYISSFVYVSTLLI